jgi:hypothetical protein
MPAILGAQLGVEPSPKLQAIASTLKSAAAKRSGP